MLGEPDYPDPDDDLIGAWAKRIGASRRAILSRGMICLLLFLIAAGVGSMLFGPGDGAVQTESSPLLHVLFLASSLGFLAAAIWLMLEIAAPHRERRQSPPKSR